jgi:hypothetical protein
MRTRDMIRQRATSIGAAVLLLALSGLTGYYFGFRNGRSSGYSSAADLLKGSAFVASFGALQRLRQGDMSNAVYHLEAFCYSTGADLFEYGRPKGKAVATWFAPDLLKYRSLYSNSPPNQYASELRLDQLLLQAGQNHK